MAVRRFRADQHEMSARSVLCNAGKHTRPTCSTLPARTSVARSAVSCACVCVRVLYHGRDKRQEITIDHQFSKSRAWFLTRPTTGPPGRTSDHVSRHIFTYVCTSSFEHSQQTAQPHVLYT